MTANARAPSFLYAARILLTWRSERPSTSAASLAATLPASISFNTFNLLCSFLFNVTISFMVTFSLNS